MAKLYTRDNLMNQANWQAAFQNMDNRANAVSENRRQWANNAGLILNSLGEMGKAAWNKKVETDRFNSIDDKDAKYKEDPTWIAAKEEYARTGNSNVLNTVRNTFDAKERAEIERKKYEQSEQLLAQEALNTINIDIDTLDSKIAALAKSNLSSTEKLQKKTELENEKKKLEIAKRKYEQKLGINSDTMPAVYELQQQMPQGLDLLTKGVAKPEVVTEESETVAETEPEATMSFQDYKTKAQSLINDNNISAEKLADFKNSITGINTDNEEYRKLMQEISTGIEDKKEAEYQSIANKLNTFASAHKKYNYSEKDLVELEKEVNNVPDVYKGKAEMTDKLNELKKNAKENKPQYEEMNVDGTLYRRVIGTKKWEAQ